MRIDDIMIRVGAMAFPPLSVEYSDGLTAHRYERHGRWYSLKGPRYPGEGNRQQRRAAAKGKVRK